VRRWSFRASVLFLAACLVPLAVRLVFRDRIAGLAALTYATPVCVLAALAALACALAAYGGRRRLAAATAALAGALGVWAVAGEVSLHPNAGSGRYRGLLWNVDHGHLGWDRVAARVRAEDPDIAAFIDAGRSPGAASTALASVLQDRNIYWWNDVLALAVRGRITDARYYPLGLGSHAGVAHVEIDGRRLTVVVVHPRSSPTESRGPAFAQLESLLASLDGEPLLVLGDFNTPSDSVFFDPLRAHLHSAFETVGMGFAGSWPMPIPLLAIDQVWSSDSLSMRSCHLSGSSASDHRLVAFSFD